MSQSSKLQNLGRSNPNLSREQMNHLIAVAGDHRVPEAEWVKACELLGPFQPESGIRKRKLFWQGVVLSSGALLIVGAVVVNQFFATPTQIPAPIPESVTSAPPDIAAPADEVSTQPAWGPYMADLQRRIKRAWFPMKSDTSKKIVVRFNVGTDGSLSKLHLQKSSGSSIADNAALKAVENAAPFRKLPEGADPQVDIEFTFDYNVFEGNNSLPGDTFSSYPSPPDPATTAPTP